jgi:purine nucleosidase
MTINTPISMVIDTDTASDDAVALIIAAAAKHVSIRAVTTVAGNVPVAASTRNALITLETAGHGNVPVYQGLGEPLTRPLETAQDVHGEDGMGDIGLADPSGRAQVESAIDALGRIARDEPGEHMLVTLGPLTNIAAALRREPDLLTRFTHVVSMGGAFDGVGNCNAVGEFNIWADPEAAQIFFDAPGHKMMVGWEIARLHSVMSPAQQQQLANAGPLGKFAVDINVTAERFDREHNGLGGYALADPIAMAVAVDPTIATRISLRSIRVGLNDDRGGTFDRIGGPQCAIVDAVDEAAYRNLLLNSCR